MKEPALDGERQVLRLLEQLAKYFVLKSHEVQVLELEDFVLGRVRIDLDGTHEEDGLDDAK
jgi:hypothetical protein